MVETVEIKRDETTSEKPVEENSTLSKPEGLPEKFNSVEDLAKSYAELEAKLGTNTEQPVKEETPVQETQKGELDIAENVVENAGLDMNSLADEYAENGKLNDESYQALEKSGIPKEKPAAVAAPVAPPPPSKPDTPEESFELVQIGENTPVRELAEKLNVNLPENEDDYDTFGGFVLSLTGHFPKKNDQVSNK